LTKPKLQHNRDSDSDSDSDSDGDNTMRRGYQTGGRLVPIPDPTALTSALVKSAINDFRREIETRFDGMDKAANLLHEDYIRVPTLLDRAILSLRELMETQIEVRRQEFVGKVERLAAETIERFLGVAAQFSERDTRTDQRAGDTKLAVDAAFAAAKEATAKIEAGFTKQIDGMDGMINTKWQNSEDKIADVKDRNNELSVRLGALEARLAGIAAGTREVRTETHQSSSSIVAITAVIIAGLSLLVALAAVAVHVVK
jgi:hypothetical protein